MPKELTAGIEQAGPRGFLRPQAPVHRLRRVAHHRRARTVDRHSRHRRVDRHGARRRHRRRDQWRRRALRGRAAHRFAARRHGRAHRHRGRRSAARLIFPLVRRPVGQVTAARHPTRGSDAFGDVAQIMTVILRCPRLRGPRRMNGPRRWRLLHLRRHPAVALRGSPIARQDARERAFEGRAPQGDGGRAGHSRQSSVLDDFIIAA